MDTKPLITIITPTLGRKTLIDLKDSLRHENIPYVHFIMFDNNRCDNSLSPNELEDENTYCYEIKHPLYPPKNHARMDVLLRAYGALMARTPYVCFKDDDTWVEPNHLESVLNFMTNEELDFCYCIRRMWTREGEKLGIDNFEATGELNQFGYTLIDNSSIYLNTAASRIIANVFLDNPIYGDDRLTHIPLKQHFRGKRLNSVLVNHRSQPELENFFRNNCSPE